MGMNINSLRAAVVANQVATIQAQKTALEIYDDRTGEDTSSTRTDLTAVQTALGVVAAGSISVRAACPEGEDEDETLHKK